MRRRSPAPAIRNEVRFMTQVADTIGADAIVFDLPAALDAAGAAALIADMVKLPHGNEISLNAQAVAEVSLGYLQILASAFKTFPKLTVSAASAEFAEVFDSYGIAFPFAEAPAGMAPVNAASAAEAEIEQVQAAPAETTPPLVPDMASAAASSRDAAPTETAVAAKTAAVPVETDFETSAEAAAAKTILTIDDSRTMRDMLRLTLDGAGFTVVQAVDGQDGLKVLPQQPVDVIITDINMPKLDGYGVIRAVRADPTYDDTPILVLSTEAEQGSKDIANEAGANGWIVKPFDP
jgi:two-component system chemotaxis response regulator CheY